MHDGEEGRGGSDAKRHNEDGNDGKPWRASQRADAVAEVAYQRLEGVAQSGAGFSHAGIIYAERRGSRDTALRETDLRRPLRRDPAVLHDAHILAGRMFTILPSIVENCFAYQDGALDHSPREGNHQIGLVLRRY